MNFICPCCTSTTSTSSPAAAEIFCRRCPVKVRMVRIRAGRELAASIDDRREQQLELEIGGAR